MLYTFKMTKDLLFEKQAFFFRSYLMYANVFLQQAQQIELTKWKKCCFCGVV